MLSNTERTKVKKGAHKAVLEQEKLHQIIDESLIGHVAFVQNDKPVVIPTLVWRVGDFVYLHGAKNSRLMKRLKKGAEVCITMTLFDGWVLARSAFHHSAHYRSAVIFGQFTCIEQNSEKSDLLNHFIEQIAPGRLSDIRLGSEKELAATELLQMPLNEASVKIGCHGVNDDEKDLSIPAWAGILPYRTLVGPLQPTDDLDSDIQLPDYSAAYGDRWFEEK